MVQKKVDGLILVLLILMSFCIDACRKDHSAVVDPPVVYVTKAQVDIPWPGVAPSPWPMFAHDPQHTGRSPFKGPQLGVVEAMFNVNDNVYSTPVIGTDGALYFEGSMQSFTALNPSFTPRWQVSAGGGKGSALIGNDGTIYVRGSLKTASSDPERYIFAFDPSGTMKWAFRVADRDRSSYLYGLVPSKDGNTIYVTGDALVALRTSGELAWVFVPPDSNELMCDAPAISPDGRMIVACSAHYLYAIDTTGHLIWKYAGSDPTSPSIDNDGNIYTISPKLISLSPTGQLRWSTQLTAYAGPMAPPVIGRDGTIYVSGSMLQAYDYAGKLKWSYDYKCVLPSGSAPAIDADGTIYVGRCNERGPVDTLNFLAFKPDGSLKFAMSLPVLDGSHAPDVDSGPSISADGRIYVGSDYPRGVFVYKIK